MDNINDRVIRNMICTNTAIKELIYGHLYTQGYIKSVADIEKIEIANEDIQFCLKGRNKDGSDKSSRNCQCGKNSESKWYSPRWFF